MSAVGNRLETVFVECHVAVSSARLMYMCPLSVVQTTKRGKNTPQINTGCAPVDTHCITRRWNANETRVLHILFVSISMGECNLFFFFRNGTWTMVLMLYLLKFKMLHHSNICTDWSRLYKCSMHLPMSEWAHKHRNNIQDTGWTIE